MAEPRYSRYSVSWMCRGCGEKWADLEHPDDPCTATEGCTGDMVGFAFWEEEPEDQAEAARLASAYTVTDDDGTQTRYNSDGTHAP